LITEAIVEAFLQCPVKAHYLLAGRAQPKSEYEEFDEHVERLHVHEARLALALRSPFTTASGDLPLVHDDLVTHPDALERVGRRGTMVMPVRIFRRAQLSEFDRMRLAFDGLVVQQLLGKMPGHGVAILGPDFRRSRVALSRFARRA
jgi:hypothetical protein